MSLSLHTNFAQMLTQNNVYKSNDMMSSAMERLSTGFRINTASDDAAGLQIANRMEAQTRGMSVAQRNAQDAVSLLQTAEGALTELNDIGLRMKDLATQAANGTNSQSERNALDAEFQELKAEFGSIFENTAYGGAKVFEDGHATDTNAFFEQTLDLQIGTTGGAADRLSIDIRGKTDSLESMYASDKAVVGGAAIYAQLSDDSFYKLEAGQTLSIREAAGTATNTEVLAGDEWVDIADVYTAANTTTAVTNTAWGVVDASAVYDGTSWVGTDAAAITLGAGTVPSFTDKILDDNSVGSLTYQASAQSAIDNVSAVLSDISSLSSSIGSKVNRLGHTMSNLGNQEINVETARGRIMDADFAQESANFTKYQLLLQAGTSMLSQTGQTSQLALSLLR